ncbi:MULTISPECIES: hypothetical protein [Streptomyces]|uniref:Uncharacterized protein n=1 Tax=Streptomyces achmelvichensis TaxID=3134111 RepID=A0ACC6Q6S6_9ACTN|nr:hypothetical protein OG317_34695 [Streptomyces sp. NBC_01167]
MYEMWAGATAAGEDPAWHVLAPDKTKTLCGLRRSEDQEEYSTERHCFPCMTAFQHVIEPPERVR